MMSLPKLQIHGAPCPVIFIQGGMGVGISTARLAGSVASHGAVGTISVVALDRIVGKRLGQKVTQRDAVALEVLEAKRLAGGRGVVAVNCMVLVQGSYAISVQGAIEGGAAAIIAGAGLPLDLPELAGNADIGLIPIVSSARALELICRRWSRNGRIPDAVILEGPLAGGHLGYKMDEITNPDFSLEAIFPQVKAVAQLNGDFPVIVAGGIYTREDIVRWMFAGADGVQMGTRFAATDESGASEEFKAAIVAVQAEGLEIAMNPGSPSGLPFRVIKTSPGYILAQRHGRPLLCDKGYLLREGKDGKLTCPALVSAEKFCICNVLLSAADCNPTGDAPVFTVGANAIRVDRVMGVAELMAELTGLAGLPKN